MGNQSLLVLLFQNSFVKKQIILACFLNRFLQDLLRYVSCSFPELIYSCLYV